MIRYLLIFLSIISVYSCGDTDNTEPPAELVEFEPTLKVNNLWTISTGSGVEQQFVKLFPLFTTDRIIVADRNGDVTSYDINTGKERWSISLDVVLSGGVGGDKDHLILTSRNGHVIMLDSKGKLIWKVDASSEVLMPAQIAGDLVIIRSVDGRLAALNLKDGSENWSYTRDVPALSLRGNSSPIIKQGYIFNGLDNGRLVTLDLLDGHTVFDIAIATPTGRSELERLVDIDGDSVMTDDTLYMGSYQGRIVSLDIRRGQLNWSRKLSTYTGVEYASSSVFTSDDKDHVWALDATNGATLWKQDKLQARTITRPVSFADALVIADYEGYIHWLSPFDGHFLARVSTDGSGVIIPPVVFNNRLYVLTRDGELSVYTVGPLEESSTKTSDMQESD